MILEMDIIIPKKERCLFTYDNVYLREPNEEEEEWIKLKCRYNPKQDEITEENQDQIEKEDEVLSNILREYQFANYKKAGEGKDNENGN